MENYQYIGGAYGTSNMRDIMEEIQTKGPIVLNFEPAYDFMYYGGGIYHSKEEISNQSDAEWVFSII